MLARAAGPAVGVMLARLPSFMRHIRTQPGHKCGSFDGLCTAVE
jgi:hypothetical protein